MSYSFDFPMMMKIQIKQFAGVVSVLALIGLASLIYGRRPISIAGTLANGDKVAESKTLPEASPNRISTQKREEIEIGKSNNNIPMKATIYGTGKKTIIVLGGIHGNEPSSVVLAKALALSLQKSEIQSDLKIVVVPTVNPDGLKSNTRMNSRNIDINRNFPSASWRAEATKDRYQPGKTPASEPETRAIIDLLNTYQPKLIVSIHAPLACVNWDGPAEEIAKIIAEASGYPLKREIGYETPGSLGTYAGNDRKIPTITFELRTSETDAQIEKNVVALRKAFSYIASR